MNEVKLNDGGQSTTNMEFSATADGIVVEDPEDNDGKDWASLNEIGENLGLPHDGDQPQTISEQIAQVSTNQSLSIQFLTAIPEIHLALSPQSDKDDPTFCGQQTPSNDTAVILGPGARIPVRSRQFNLACTLGG